MNAYDYSITICRVEPYLYRATIAELPDVAEYNVHWSIVYDLAIDTIETTAEAIGWENMPEPIYKYQ